MNVFVLCAGRCGSVTLSKACQHITNFTSGHESTAGLHVDKRFDFSDNHIEIDNRLTWMLGKLDEAYADSALYVYLTRNESAIAQSYNRRWDSDVSIAKAYTHGILMRDSEGLDDCIDYVKTVDGNIRHFLKDKSRVLEISLENIEQGFRSLWHEIGAEGDLEVALAEVKVSHNATASQSDAKKPPVGGNHSFISRKTYSVLSKLQKNIEDINSEKKSLSRELSRGKDSSKALKQEFKALKVHLDVTKNNLANERRMLKEIKQSLAFHVGTSVANGIGTGRLKYLKLSFSPLFVARGIRRYLVAKHNRAISQVGTNDGLAVESKKAKRQPEKDWPVPLKSNIAWNAMKVMDDVGIDDAIEFLNCYCGKEQDFLKGIFAANKDLKDGKDEGWVSKINSYLARYDLSPISLAVVDQKKQVANKSSFTRICSAVVSEQYIDRPEKISVIMPAFNSEKTVSHAIESILNQTWRNIELIVVDDCSKDETWSIIQALAKSDDRIKAIRNVENVGPYVSKNIALEHVTGEFITGHDADDWAHPQRLQKQVDSLLVDDSMKANIGRMVRISPDLTMNFFTKIGKISNDGVARLAFISCMFRTNEFRQHLGAWDCVRFGGDSELIERAKIVFEEGFATLDIITMLCLDADGSLTNNPHHGISKMVGVSSTRAQYRDAWLKWHETLSVDSVRLNFPHEPRRFSVPKAAEVERKDIYKNLKSMQLELA